MSLTEKLAKAKLPRMVKECLYDHREFKQRHDELARRGVGKNVALRAGRLIARFPKGKPDKHQRLSGFSFASVCAKI